MESLSDDQHRSPQKVAHPDVNSSSFSSPTMSNHAPHTSASRRSIVPIDEDTQFYPDASAITTSPLHLLRDMNLDSPSHQGLSLSQQGLNVSVFSSTDAVNTCRPDIKLTKSSLEDPYLDDNVDGTLSQQSSSEYLPFSDEDRRKKRTPIASLYSETTLGLFSAEGVTPISPASEVDDEHVVPLHRRQMQQNQNFISKPRNEWEAQMLTMGRQWRFPINNEQGLEDNKTFTFEDHVFLDHRFDEFSHSEAALKHVELVITGLQQNPHMTSQQKVNVIKWHKDYFKEETLTN